LRRDLDSRVCGPASSRRRLNLDSRVCGSALPRSRRSLDVRTSRPAPSRGRRRLVSGRLVDQGGLEGRRGRRGLAPPRDRRRLRRRDELGDRVVFGLGRLDPRRRGGHVLRLGRCGPGSGDDRGGRGEGETFPFLAQLHLQIGIGVLPSALESGRVIPLGRSGRGPWTGAKGGPAVLFGDEATTLR
jgi:hypothetical protein